MSRPVAAKKASARHGSPSQRPAIGRTTNRAKSTPKSSPRAVAQAADDKKEDAVSTKKSTHKQLDIYTSEYLLQWAEAQDAMAQEQAKLAESFDSLPSKLGDVLQKKMEEGIQTKKEVRGDPKAVRHSAFASALP